VILSDTSLVFRLGRGDDDEKRIRVEPLADGAIQPCSIDVRLGESLWIRSGDASVDPRRPELAQWEPSLAASESQDCWYLWPGVPYLATTLERIEVPRDLVCRIEGKSSIARLFIVVHQQAGLLDPGYRGRPSLEITVTRSTILYPGMPIAQLTFQQLDRPAARPYGHPDLGSHYQGDEAPTPARLVLP
jgi:dCTP deaminase